MLDHIDMDNVLRHGVARRHCVSLNIVCGPGGTPEWNLTVDPWVQFKDISILVGNQLRIDEDQEVCMVSADARVLHPFHAICREIPRPLAEYNAERLFLTAVPRRTPLPYVTQGPARFPCQCRFPYQCGKVITGPNIFLTDSQWCRDPVFKLGKKTCL
jgi:hypothetical protein